MSPVEEARQIVWRGLHDVRVWLGETTDEHENYVPRHAQEETA